MRAMIEDLASPTVMMQVVGARNSSGRHARLPDRWMEDVRMPDDESLPERIRRKKNQLSVSQQKVARYCLTSSQKAGTLAALRIAEELEVSESTVVRFAVKMGYRGFPDMQAAIRRAWELRAEEEYPEAKGQIDGKAADSLRGDMTSLQQTIASLELGRLAGAADALVKAQRIHVCGFRTSFSLAFLAEFHIRQVHHSVRLIDGVGGTHVDDVALIEPDDALLAFTFPVYDDRTIDTVKRAVDVGAQTVVVTDSALAPLPIARHLHTLTVRHDSVTFFNSTVAATALLNALVVRMVELRTEAEPGFEERLTERFQQKRGTERDRA
jgi:DNA-binding MurR/RpiR family transcriptional regulator